MGCRCGVIKVGGKPTHNRDWTPDCPEHGTASTWYQSPEQIKKRATDNEQLRDLQRRAREARNAARRENVETPND